MTRVNPEFWRGKRVFLTGHTGFKGSWLSIWLQSMGAELHGYALAPPTTPALFNEGRVFDGMVSTIGDLRDYNSLCRALEAARPEIIIHMAAQSLVRHSYQAPVETYAVNVMGTVHVLEAARHLGGVRAIVNVTTDKCYENQEWVWGYRESEALGGYDPYSSSKACSELITNAYRRSFFQDGDVAVASARAGNVIGGGDWASDRLVPDILRAFARGEPAVIRSPHSVRPWQHVLEPLSGYLVLAERLHADGRTWAEAWNFGPTDKDARSVSWIVEQMAIEWGAGAEWREESEKRGGHEAGTLKLDISKVRARFGWEPTWTLQEALRRSVDWHKAWIAKQDVRKKSLDEIGEFLIQEEYR